MKVTIVYDNEAKKRGLKAAWGFSCLVEVENVPPILFDTGGTGSILLHNMRKLQIAPEAIGVIVISHAHWDHTGGLQDILRLNKDAQIYLPKSLMLPISGRKVVRVEDAIQIGENVFTTGELNGVEQSLAVNTDKGILVIGGCSHPGVGHILDAASKFGEVYGIIGGFHGFSDFERLERLSLICPCHCTRYKSEIILMFPEKCIECGAGLVLEL